MEKTIRQQLVELMMTQLGRILTTNTYIRWGIEKSYKSDVGANVFKWRATPFGNDELPALIFRDLDEPVEQSGLRGERHKRSLHCQIEIVGIGDAVDDDVRTMLADIENAIGEIADKGWNDLASDTRPRISRLVVEQESNRFSGAIFECFIDYPTYAFNSYA